MWFFNLVVFSIFYAFSQISHFLNGIILNLYWFRLQVIWFLTWVLCFLLEVFLFLFQVFYCFLWTIQLVFISYLFYLIFHWLLILIFRFVFLNLRALHLLLLIHFLNLNIRLVVFQCFILIFLATLKVPLFFFMTIYGVLLKGSLHLIFVYLFIIRSDGVVLHIASRAPEFYSFLCLTILQYQFSFSLRHCIFRFVLWRNHSLPSNEPFFQIKVC